MSWTDLGQAQRSCRRSQGHLNYQRNVYCSSFLPHAFLLLPFFNSVNSRHWWQCCRTPDNSSISLCCTLAQQKLWSKLHTCAHAACALLAHVTLKAQLWSKWKSQEKAICWAKDSGYRWLIWQKMNLCVIKRWCHVMIRETPADKYV